MLLSACLGKRLGLDRDVGGLRRLPAAVLFGRVLGLGHLVDDLDGLAALGLGVVEGRVLGVLVERDVRLVN